MVLDTCTGAGAHLALQVVSLQVILITNAVAGCFQSLPLPSQPHSIIAHALQPVPHYTGWPKKIAQFFARLNLIK